MTTAEIVEYYSKLLILQYADKPKAVATVQALITPVIMDQLPLDVQDSFNVDTAEGVQLDIVGKYLGVERTGYSFTGAINLDDDEFRIIIKFAIVRNTNFSSLAVIQELMNTFFPGDFLVFDNQNMYMSFYFSTNIGSQQLAEKIVLEDLLPHPMGVGVASVIYAPNIDNLYGWGSYLIPSYNVSGFNTYSSYNTGTPWMNYSYVLYI